MKTVRTKIGHGRKPNERKLQKLGARKSFMKSENNKGESLKPWGRLFFKAAVEEFVPSIFINSTLSVRKIHIRV